MKYGIWNVHVPEQGSVNALVSAGYSPLAAMVLASRGIRSDREAQSYLDCNAPLVDPFAMKDMDLAVQRLRLAMARGEKVAVFGDYDVDGITATCLLTDFLRRHGTDCVSYIPGRLEEGYGLNPIALQQLSQEGVTLIITVDCGITALEEAQLCRELGMDLVITDHHECKSVLPEAVAVVDPHRPDCTYPHKTLSGVGVAFKLAAALCGDQQEVLAHYADMVCLGTVADVMPLQGENRLFVTRGLEALRHTCRPGIAALMKESGCSMPSLNAGTLGFVLAPRINAAGRMGKIDLAVELFLTQDPERAECLSRTLCELNRQRQSVESDIYTQALTMLPKNKVPDAIVLADDSWHQGVVGIVASRMAEEFCRPTFLICMDGQHGKASSRSYGGFNLFSSLTALSPLLESYGGHELAAGFTISREQIPRFRQEICQLAAEYYADQITHTQLDVDCCIPPELLTVRGIDGLSDLEPTGSGCPKPLLMIEKMTVERISMVGGGRHMRLKLRSGAYAFSAICFSTTPECFSIEPEDVVDVAFSPQVNEYRGERTVQMNITDIRPHCHAPCCPDPRNYRNLRRGTLNAQDAQLLLPDRDMLARVWRYLAAVPGPIREDPLCLCRKIVRWTDLPLSLGQFLTCLDIFQDVGLLKLQQHHRQITVELTSGAQKADLNESQTLRLLVQAKES